jgi:hypothetical protein
MNVDPPHVDPDRESWREQVRQLPGVVVHRPQPLVPYVPDVWVINVSDVHDQTGENVTEPEEGDSTV